MMCMANEITRRHGPLGAALWTGLIVAYAGRAAAQTPPPASPWDTPASSPWGEGLAAGGSGLPIDQILCGFLRSPLTGHDILLLVGIALLLALLGFGLYRIGLEDLVRRGLRPSVLTWTIVSICIGVFLLLAFALIPNVLGPCLFAILAGLFLLYLIIAMIIGKILRGIGLAFVLLAIAAVVLLQFI